MHYVPIGLRLVVATTSRIMVSESVKRSVPQWSMDLYECRFNCSNHVRARILKNHETAHEVLNVEVCAHSNTLAVLSKPGKQLPRLRGWVVCNPGLPPSFWYCFANVDGMAVGQAIQFTITLIYPCPSCVVQSIDTSPKKRFSRGQLSNRRTVEKTNGIFDEFYESIVFVNMLGTVEWLWLKGHWN